MSESTKIGQCIANVMAELAKQGISKDRNNTQQNYKFRGIDDIYNAIAPLLPKFGVYTVPRIKDREVTERATAKGGVLFYVSVTAEFDFVSVEDGSKITAITFGEAMDSGDKATNKAMSAAQKYACIMTFCIPTDGSSDTETQSYDVLPDTITESQYSKLVDLMDATKTNHEQFAKVCKVDDIKNLPTQKFDTAHNLLIGKLNKQNDGAK